MMKGQQHEISMGYEGNFSIQSGHRFLHTWHRLLRWQELKRQRFELAQLGDNALKDMGLTRADILQESERPFWDDPLRK